MGNIITTSIDGEKLRVLTGFKTNEGEILISDSDTMGDLEKVRVVIQPSLIRFWIKDGLLKDLGMDKNIERYIR